MAEDDPHGGGGGKEPDKAPHQRRRNAAVEELTHKIGARGQPAVREEGEGLAVDGKPRPPQHKGGHGNLPRQLSPLGQAGDTGGQLDEPGEELLTPTLRQSKGA